MRTVSIKAAIEAWAAGAAQVKILNCKNYKGVAYVAFTLTEFGLVSHWEAKVAPVGGLYRLTDPDLLKEEPINK